MLNEPWNFNAVDKAAASAMACPVNVVTTGWLS